MITRYNNLKIDGAFISNLTVLPSKAIRLNLFSAPKGTSERQVVQEKHLQFDGVKRFQVVLDAKPWLEVRAHRILQDSDYLKNYLDEVAQHETSKAEDEVSLYHFQIICDEGEINIIAQSFLNSVVDEIPFIAHNQAVRDAPPQTEQQIGSKLPLSSELVCSFCLKAQADLATIITGSTGNICDDCIRTCVGLLNKS